MRGRPMIRCASVRSISVGISTQRYVECPDGQATFQALADAVEIAELDAHALTAYSKVPIFQGPEGEEALASKLVEVGYSRMASALPEDPSVVLWSVRRGFNT
nr:hypothetical protein [Tanacetum cinerariifolium]